MKMLKALALVFFAAPVFAAQRSFLMGTTVIHDIVQVSFENLSDKDLLSLHLDDFLGIPWNQFQNGMPLPVSWVSQWTNIQTQAQSSGKVLYLAVSPLADRKRLTDTISSNGTKTSHWAPVDANGCYPFATDPNAQVYKLAYINYLKYLVDLLHPTYLSPGIEIDIPFAACPAQKTAFIQWYSDIHQALKQAYPNLIIFPTFSAETMYGINDNAASWCGGPKTDASLAACFQQHLHENVAIPGDRMAFSTYPLAWYAPARTPDTYTRGVPLEDMFQRVQNTTRKKIWISETGFMGVQIHNSYQHASPASSCGPILITTPTIAGESNMASYMSALLAQAQSKQFEAVVWWENRDLMDANAAGACPCPGPSTSCDNAEAFYQVGGTATEIVFRFFANMGLRYYDGTPRTAVYNLWISYLNQTYSPVPGGDPRALDQIQIYPNPLRPSQGHTAIHFNQLPSGSRLRVYTLLGEKVKELNVDTGGHAAWDGSTPSGQKAASGIYLVYVQRGEESKTLKVGIQR